MRVASIVACAAVWVACSKDPPKTEPPHTEPKTATTPADAAPLVQNSCTPTPREGTSCTVSGKHCAVPGMCEPCQRCLIRVCETGRWVTQEELPDPHGCDED